MKHQYQYPKTKQQVEDIVASVALVGPLYPEGTHFRVLEKGDGFLLQLCYPEEDIYTGEVEEQHARKWYVSPHATETEVVQTIHAAITRSLRHRLGEAFLYRGRRVFSPHHDMMLLWSISGDDDLDWRGK